MSEINLVGAPPDMIRWIPRNAENLDCAVCAIQLACGVTYESALEEAIRATGSLAVVNKGMYWPAIKKVIEALGYKWKLRRKFNIHEDTGILYVSSKMDSHVVYLWEGRVIEPADQTMWKDPVDYLKVNKREAKGLLEVYK